ncbi:MAG: hypothetical protein HZC25_12305 [Rhodospirillales bacterium]|nr:hypothetical protein [Rhodospirillales bacterium]
MSAKAVTSAPAARWTFFLLVIACVLLIARHQWSADIRESDDDVTYLSYAMSLGIDGDLDFSNELKCCRNMALNGRVPGGFYGAGLMAAPFVTLFSLVDRAVRHPVIKDRSQYRHSWSYFGFSFAVHFYFLAAVFLLARTARSLDRRAGPAMVLLMAVGSGVYYFVFGRPRMAHGFEFFALSLALYGGALAATTLQEKGLRLWWATGVGALGAVLTVGVRFSDLNVLLLPVLSLLLVLSLTPSAPPAPSSLKEFLFRYAIALCLALFPLGLLNLAVYDHVLLTSRVVYANTTQLTSLESGSPVIAQWLGLLKNLPVLLFGSEFGLLYTHPVASLGTGAAILMLFLQMARRFTWLSLVALLLVLAYAGFSIMIVLIWKSPGMSFGYRSLFPLFPLGFLGWWLLVRQCPAMPRNVLMSVMAGLCLLSFAGQALFTKTRDLGYRPGVSSMGLEGQSADGFQMALLRGVATAEPWTVAIKDGPLGFMGKMYFSKPYLDWRIARLQGKAVAAPERQHPPIDGAFLGILGLMWLFWSALLLRDRKIAEANDNGMRI